MLRPRRLVRRSHSQGCADPVGLRPTSRTAACSRSQRNIGRAQVRPRAEHHAFQHQLVLLVPRRTRMTVPRGLIITRLVGTGCPRRNGPTRPETTLHQVDATWSLVSPFTNTSRHSSFGGNLDRLARSMLVTEPPRRNTLPFPLGRHRSVSQRLRFGTFAAHDFALIHRTRCCPPGRQLRPGCDTKVQPFLDGLVAV